MTVPSAFRRVGAPGHPFDDEAGGQHPSHARDRIVEELHKAIGTWKDSHGQPHGQQRIDGKAREQEDEANQLAQADIHGGRPRLLVAMDRSRKVAKCIAGANEGGKTAMTDTAKDRLEPVRLWLWAVLGLLFVMIVVGGLTRLTDSGLSITEWRPVTGAIPPLNETDWLSEFDRYRASSEYQMQNRGMSLAEFKEIYWWEWGHRFLGRLIGFVFAVPFVVFLVQKRIDRPLGLRLGVIFVLGGLQGALGWFMVQSGLSERVDVSQYRLAAHLGVAFVIFAATLWVLLGLAHRKRAHSDMAPRTRRLAAIMVVAVFVQILLGALVAGLDAGLTYNTWPLMDGQLVPNGLFQIQPVMLNFFENITMVQFQHRILAYLIAALVVWLWLDARRSEAARTANVLAGLVAAQILLGVWTLLAVVPLWLGVAHQAMAVMVFAMAIVHAYRVR